MTLASEMDPSGGAGLLIPERPLSEPRRKQGTGGDFPPIDWDDFGGGGGGGGGDDGDGADRSGDGSDEGARRRTTSVAEFGLGLGLAAIGSVFLAVLGAYFSLAYRAEEWPPAQLASAPAGLWLSTLVLLCSSFCVAKAVRSREDSGVSLWLSATLLLGVLFLLAQIEVWHAMHSEGLLPSNGGYGAMFYTLTGLHGSHVLAGIAYIGTLLLRSRAIHGPRLSRNTVRLCGVYWHFIAGIWLVLFCVL